MSVPTATVTTSATEPRTKLEGFAFWRKGLGGAKHVMAPMVDQSEQAWRTLCRRYGTDLCYTPMLHARLFAEQEKYREEHFTTDPTDRPLIAQFCANDADTLLAAAKLVEDRCDAVDINLGCPQDIARRGKYGSFLQDDWETIASMVRTLHKHLAIPVTVKIRVFPEVEKTLRYARMIEEAGAQLLCVHGRVREQRGHLTGLADWEQIRAVREALSIPVIANGNILEPEDVPRCLAATGAVAVMSAEGNLYNPAIFSGTHPEVWRMGQEYLAICRRIPTRLSAIRGHLFKMYRPCLVQHTDIRDRLGRATDLDALEALTADLAARLQAEAAAAPPSDGDYRGMLMDEATGRPKHAYWLCQPYVRPPMAPPKKQPEVVAEGKEEKEAPMAKRQPEVAVEGSVDLLAREERKRQKREENPQCSKCKNGASVKCEGRLCRQCCRGEGSSAQCLAHQTRRQREEVVGATAPAVSASAEALA